MWNWKEISSDISRSDLIKLRIVGFIQTFGDFIVRVFVRLFYKRSKKITRILIFRTGSLGDSICAIPSIQSIINFYPEAKTDILTNAGRSNLVGLHHLLDGVKYNQVIDYYSLGKWDLMRKLRKNNYDLIIQLSQVDASLFRLLRDIVVFRFVAKSGWGWSLCQVKLFRKSQARNIVFINETNRLLHIITSNGVLRSLNEKSITLNASDLSKAYSFLELNNLSDNKNLIAIVPGSKRPQNRWPIEYFGAVIEELAQEYYFLVIGSKDEVDLVKPLLSNKRVISACGKLLPLESAALISLCRLTISNDTGPMHLSYAVGTPTIALFSSRDLPGKWYPEGDNNQVFRTVGVHCEGCFSETCGNNICMQAIKPSDVINTAKNILVKLDSNK